MDLAAAGPHSSFGADATRAVDVVTRDAAGSDSGAGNPDVGRGDAHSPGSEDAKIGSWIRGTVVHDTVDACDGKGHADGTPTPDSVHDAGVADAGSTDAGGSPSTIDAQNGDATTSDAGPQTCFINGPPGPNASVANVPKPDFSLCTLGPPNLFKAGQPVGQPTLKVELGTHDPVSGAFVPYADDQWLPILHGPQGGFHVFLATRVTIPGKAGSSVKLLAESLGYAGCKLAAKGHQPLLYAAADPTVPHAFTTASKTSAGTMVVFPAPSSLSHLYCGIWLELVVRVRQIGSASWGESTVTVRLYDTK